MLQGLEEGKSSYQGIPCRPRAGQGNGVSRGHSSYWERAIEEMEDSQDSEGLNIRMFQIRQGGNASPALSGTG
jgi:hypothetical protein